MAKYYLTQTAEEVQEILNAVGGKQEAIEAVEVTVDNSVGTPAASVSMTGGELSFEFRNLKGVQGEKGDTVVLGDGEEYTLYNSTGSNTDGAMTQKVVTDSVTYQETLDLSDINNISISTTPTKEWASTYKGIFLPVNPNERYLITSSVNGGVVIPLKTLSFALNASYADNIATGYSDRVTISAGETVTITIPSDCYYLYVQKTASGGDITPAIARIKAVNSTDETPVQEQIKKEESELRVLAYDGWVSNFFITQELYWASSANRSIALYKVNEGDMLKIEAADDVQTYYTYIAAFDTVDELTAVSSRYILPAGESVLSVAPHGTVYLAIEIGNAGHKSVSRYEYVNPVDVNDKFKLLVYNGGGAKSYIYPSVSQRKWTRASGRYSVFLPIDASSEYLLVGNTSQNVNTYYVITKSRDYANNGAIDFATGESEVHTLPVGTTAKITTSSDAAYICFMCDYSGADIAPSAIYKLSSLENLSHNLAGKKILCVGDSVTWMQYYTDEFEHLTKCLLYNRGVSGATVADYDGNLTKAFVNRADLAADDTDDREAGFPTDADYILVLGGVNDWARVRRDQTFTLGDITAANTKTTFIGAWKYLLSSLKAKYPTAKIITMLMYDVYTDASGTTLNHSEVTLTDGADIANGHNVISETTTGQSTAVSFNDLRDAIKAVSKLYGADCLDLREAGFSAFVATDRTNFFNNADGLHVNALGGEYIAKHVVGRLF